MFSKTLIRSLLLTAFLTVLVMSSTSHQQGIGHFFALDGEEAGRIPREALGRQARGIAKGIDLFSNAYFEFDDGQSGAVATQAVEQNARFAAEHYGLNIVPLYNLRYYPDLITRVHAYNPEARVYMHMASFCCMREYHDWFDDVTQNHPDWFLRDESGNTLMWEENPLPTWFMDIGNPAYQDYWIERVMAVATSENSGFDGWDGIYIDNVQAQLWSSLHDNTTYRNDFDYEDAAYRFLSRISLAFHEAEMPLLINLWLRPASTHPFGEWLALTDGIKIEHFVSTWTTGYHDEQMWELQVSRLEQIGQAGKIATVYPKFRNDDLQARFYGLASYLLGKQDENQFFYYQVGDDYQFPPRFWYDEWSLSVGSPLAERYFEQGVWQRDYSNAKVLVNPSATDTFVVELNGEYQAPDGTVVSDITLTEHSGAIVLRKR